MTQQANEQLRESLSALVDNQASELELRRILKQVEQDSASGDSGLLRDDSLAKSWQRYHLAGEILRGVKPIGLKVDLSSAISAAIAQESLPSPRSSRNWQSWFGKSALAASVALAVLVGVRQYAAGPANAPLAAIPVSESVPSANQVAQVGGSDVAQLAGTNDLPTTQEAPAGFALPLPDARTVSSNGNLINGAAVRYRNSSELQPMALPSQNWRNDPALQQELNQLLIDHAARASANGSMGILPFARISTMNGSQEKNGIQERQER